MVQASHALCDKCKETERRVSRTARMNGKNARSTVIESATPTKRFYFITSKRKTMAHMTYISTDCIMCWACDLIPKCLTIDSICCTPLICAASLHVLRQTVRCHARCRSGIIVPEKRILIQSKQCMDVAGPPTIGHSAQFCVVLHGNESHTSSTRNYPHNCTP